MNKNQAISNRSLLHCIPILFLLTGEWLFFGLSESACGQVNPTMGARPYELDWAGRYEDDHIPLIDFENEEKWTVEVRDGSAEMGRSQEQMIWGDYTYKVTYKANSKNADFIIRPPKPVKIGNAFTAINLWVKGNYNMSEDRERKRPVTKLSVLLEVSVAIATGAVMRSQLKLEYDNGLEIWVNGNKEETWKTPFAELPPSGYYAKLPDGELEVFSALKNGGRADYVHSPVYDFMDGRGNWLETPWGASDGQLIILKNSDGSCELIPYGTEKFAVSLEKNPERTIALDMDRKEIGLVKGELKDGMYYIQPVSGAISYLVKI